MANELLVSHTSGTTVYAVARVPNKALTGYWLNVTTGLLEVFNGANWADYVIAIAELGGATGFFEANMPDGVNALQAIEIFYYEQVGLAPAMGDTKVAGSLFGHLDGWIVDEALRV